MADVRVDDRRGDLDHQFPQEPDAWVHHVADLDADGAVRSFPSERPLLGKDRLGRIGDLLAGPIRMRDLDTFERKLSPREPYQRSPLSFLNAYGRGWNLWTEADRLELAGPPPHDRTCRLEIWFMNVTPRTTAVVNMEVTASSARGDVGNLEVRSSDASPRTFPMTGSADHTLDMLVRPAAPFGVLVSLEPRGNIGYLAFRRVTYRTVPLP